MSKIFEGQSRLQNLLLISFSVCRDLENSFLLILENQSGLAKNISHFHGKYREDLQYFDVISHTLHTFTSGN